MADYDEKEDLMDRLLALGKRKKFLSLDELHREIPENMMSADDLEDVLDRLEGANISVAETDAQLLERASNMALVAASVAASGSSARSRWPCFWTATMTHCAVTRQATDPAIASLLISREKDWKGC